MRQLGLLLRAAVLVAGLLAVPAVPAAAADCSRTSVGFVALPDLEAGAYKGEPGGLYRGTNDPPTPYADAGRAAASAIVPLDAQGSPSASGKVVLLSIGMSNTTAEFSTFVGLAKQDPARATSVVVVDGAQGGQDARAWARADAAAWSIADQRLRAGGVTPAQVEAVWLKQAVAGPRGDFPTTSRELADLLDAIVRVAAQRYPQLRQVFLSPRTYAGYATTTLNPEPYAYESGFADRAVIMRSVAAATARPWIGWGPYLWTDGTRGRSDGLTWTCADVQSDGTHPSASGQQKVAQMLLAFFDGSAFTPWYRGTAAPAPTAAPTATAVPRRSAGPDRQTPTPEVAEPTAAASAAPDASLIAGLNDLAEQQPLALVGGAFLALAISTALISRVRRP